MAETGYCQCGCGRKTEIATQNRAARGWVKGEPKRFVRGHGNARRGPAPVCLEDGCEREVLARGLCRMHYQRQEKARDPERFREYTRKWNAENREKKNAGRRAAYQRDRAKHIAYSRASIIKRKYGLTVEEYDVIIDRGCAICPEKRRGTGGVSLDHDHTTGKVRDALCGKCNRGLGYFDDDPDRLRRAAAYIETHRKPLTQMEMA